MMESNTIKDVMESNTIEDVHEEGGPGGEQHHCLLNSSCNITKFNSYVKLWLD